MSEGEDGQGRTGKGRAAAVGRFCLRWAAYSLGAGAIVAALSLGAYVSACMDSVLSVMIAVVVLIGGAVAWGTSA
jgi:hypothetical protein